MREPGEIMSSLPRPGRALTGVLVALAVSAIVVAVIRNWVPGSDAPVVQWLMMKPSRVLLQPWTIVTSGLVTLSVSHILWSLVGLYFLTPTLEQQWGGARLVRFLVASVVVGNLFVLAFDYAARLLGVQASPLFNPGAVFGPSTAIAAIAVAWARQNASRRFLFMFVLPMTGKLLIWITIGFSVAHILFREYLPEGAFAPFGGIAAGLLFSGATSPARTLWLKTKLFFLRRGRGGGLSAASMLDRPSSPRLKRRGGPDLRVVQGGADDDKKPPKDKRYLN